MYVQPPIRMCAGSRLWLFMLLPGVNFACDLAQALLDVYLQLDPKKLETFSGNSNNLIDRPIWAAIEVVITRSITTYWFIRVRSVGTGAKCNFIAPYVLNDKRIISKSQRFGLNRVSKREVATDNFRKSTKPARAMVREMHMRHD